MVIAAAFVFGAANKMADFHNEHGLKTFKHANIAFAVIWAASGIYLTSVSAILAIYYIAVIMDFFVRVKLDYVDHTLASGIILFAGMYFLPQVYLPYAVISAAALTAGLALSRYLLMLFRVENRLVKRSRFIIIPLLFSILVQNYLPLLAAVAGMFGVELMVRIYRGYEFPSMGNRYIRNRNSGRFDGLSHNKKMRTPGRAWRIRKK